MLAYVLICKWLVAEKGTTLMSQRLTGGFRLSNRRWYPWVFLLLSTFFILLAYELGGRQLKIEWVVSVLGGAGGLTTFLYSQHLQETRLFTELFQTFNTRYDRLNQHLNEIAASDGTGLSTESQQLLMDYFNLCAEEYLFFRSGYIDEDVWRSWTCGMRFYAQVPAIRAIWARELESGSYYGFSLRELEKA
jgi:hypothetical protein